MKKIFMLLALLLAACGPVTPVVTFTPLPIQNPTSVATEAVLPNVLPTATLEAQLTPVSAGDYPAAVLAAQQHLAARLKLPVQQIQVTNITPTDWPDSCLGAASADQMCAQVITPGYEVIFTVAAVQYTYHTDQSGKNLRAVTGQNLPKGSQPANMLLEWTSPDCDQYSISTVAVLVGKCGQALVPVPGMNAGAGDEPLKTWVMSFVSFEADTPAGKLKFTGLGNRLTNGGFAKSIASPADQRMIAEWAKLQFAVAQSGRAGAAGGQAFSYHREGGIAGFCDDVVVYLDGHALVSNCKGLKATLFLTASEMQQVYAWFDDLKQIDYSQTDPATADSMKVTLAMPAQGQKTAEDATLSAILEYASGLTAQANSSQQAGPDASDAELALTDYFKALNGGDFALAAKLYGGPTDLLQTWNPDVKNDLPAWLKLGCKNNGLVCMLPRSARFHGLDARGGYQFSIEFNNPDGSLFVQGPCCGETNGPSISRFVFTVLPMGSDWQVMELPPYVP